MFYCKLEVLEERAYLILITVGHLRKSYFVGILLVGRTLIFDGGNRRCWVEQK